jgi:hypothetical protein
MKQHWINIDFRLVSSICNLLCPIIAMHNFLYWKLKGLCIYPLRFWGPTMITGKNSSYNTTPPILHSTRRLRQEKWIHHEDWEEGKQGYLNISSSSSLLKIVMTATANWRSLTTRVSFSKKKSFQPCVVL